MIKKVLDYLRSLVPQRLQLPQNTPAYLRNKYLLATVFFCIWVGFIDENSILERIEFEREYNKLQKDKEYYQDKIQRDAYEMEELEKNSKLELIAREKYLMKKENEDIFIIQKN